MTQSIPGASNAERTFGASNTPQRRGLRSGIIGAGFIGQVHARAVRAAGGRVTAACGSTEHAGEFAAAATGADWGAPSAEALIASPEVDVVHICTPNATHAGMVRAALAAGKHVICEKPLATTLDDAIDLAERASVASVVCAVPFVYRYYPAVREARARLGSGDLGAVQLMHGTYLQDWLAVPSDQNWRVDPALGGPSRAFADIGVHWCDLVEFVTGHRIVALTAKLKTAVPERFFDGRRQPVTTEDAATLVFETDAGAIGSLVISQISHGRKNRLWFSLDAADGSLAFDQELPDTLWLGQRESVQLLMRGAGFHAEQAQRLTMLPAGHPQGYQDCFNGLVGDVYDTAAGRPAEGLPTFGDGLRAARLTEAVITSAARGEWVQVS